MSGYDEPSELDYDGHRRNEQIVEHSYEPEVIQEAELDEFQHKVAQPPAFAAAPRAEGEETPDEVKHFEHDGYDSSEVIVELNESPAQEQHEEYHHEHYEQPEPQHETIVEPEPQLPQEDFQRTVEIEPSNENKTPSPPRGRKVITDFKFEEAKPAPKEDQGEKEIKTGTVKSLIGMWNNPAELGKGNGGKDKNYKTEYGVGANRPTRQLRTNWCE
ncbi:unnamed protein product, partial [Mesorhabditis spiculigera]